MASPPYPPSLLGVERCLVGAWVHAGGLARGCLSPLDGRRPPVRFGPRPHNLLSRVSFDIDICDGGELNIDAPRHPPQLVRALLLRNIPGVRLERHPLAPKTKNKV
jgi:hypothetical protein